MLWSLRRDKQETHNQYCDLQFRGYQPTSIRCLSSQAWISYFAFLNQPHEPSIHMIKEEIRISSVDIRHRRTPPSYSSRRFTMTRMQCATSPKHSVGVEALFNISVDSRHFHPHGRLVPSWPYHERMKKTVPCNVSRAHPFDESCTRRATVLHRDSEPRCWRITCAWLKPWLSYEGGGESGLTPMSSASGTSPCQDGSFK